MTHVSELRRAVSNWMSVVTDIFHVLFSHSREISGQKYSVGHGRLLFPVPSKYNVILLSYGATNSAFDKTMKIQVFLDDTLCPYMNNSRRFEGS